MSPCRALTSLEIHTLKLKWQLPMNLGLMLFLLCLICLRWNMIEIRVKLLYLQVSYPGLSYCRFNGELETNRKVGPLEGKNSPFKSMFN